MALMLGALMIHNITPGPAIMVEHADLFWGLIISFWIGNFILMVLNVPLIGMWVKLLKIPYRIIFPVILLLISIGVFSANNNIYDVVIVLAVGIFGFLASRLGFQPAPMLLGFVLGPMVEEHFRRSLLMSQGDLLVFFKQPISAVFLSISLLLLAFVAYGMVRKSLNKDKEPRVQAA